MRNTLGLDDDLDPDELQNALEASFGIRFSVPEATACRTVDDIFQVIRSHLSPIREGVDGCATAMAFYRLRLALSDLHIRSPLTPTTDVAALPGLSARQLLATLRQCSGLRLPRWKATLVGKAGGWMIFAGLVLLFLTAMVAPTLRPTDVLVSVVGFGLTWIDQGRLPDDCRTLGGLARKVAGLNFGDLYAQGAKARDKDLWNALLEVLSEYTLLPRAEIHPGTLIRNATVRTAYPGL